MAIMVQSPYASLDQGISQAGSALSGALNRYRQEQLDLEREQRMQEQKKDLMSFQEDLVKGREERSREQNRLAGSVIGDVFRSLQEKQESGDQVSGWDVMNAIRSIQEQTGMDYSKAAQSLDALQKREEVVAKGEERKEKFRDLVAKNRVDLQGDDLEDYMTISERFSNVKNPNERFQKTEKAYRDEMKRLDAFKKALEGPGFVERAFTGLSDQKKKSIQNRVKQLRKTFNEDRIGEILKGANFSEVEIEEVMSPLSSSEKKAINQLPKAVGMWTPGSTQMRQRQARKLPLAVKSAVEDGGSIKLVADALEKKGYNREEITAAIDEVADSVDLTPRQQRQVQEVSRGSQGRSLFQIFGLS